MKKKKGKFSSFILVIILLAGLSLVLYPSVSDYWNSLHQTQAISNYIDAVSHIEEDETERLLAAAHEYNERLKSHDGLYFLTEEEQREYESQLDVTGTGVMGYIEIPAIEVSLPIYHGTSEAVLQVAAGHLEWTSLPVGGEGTHAVISGHRGLPSATLFTHLDRLREGDVFMIQVLGEVVTYEIDRILTVEPQDVEALKIARGKDYCTLVTCTPYGINTQRYLVRGHRIDNLEEAAAVNVAPDATQINQVLVAAFLAIPVLVLILIVVSLMTRKHH